MSDIKDIYRSVRGGKKRSGGERSWVGTYLIICLFLKDKLFPKRQSKRQISSVDD